MQTLLIIEDEKAHIELIRRAFNNNESKFALKFAQNLRDAEHMMAHEKFDLIIVDWVLPDGNGLEIIYKNNNENVAKYPFLIMTSQGNELLAVESMKAGVLDYIVKSPATFIEMPRIVNRSLREWGHIQARYEAEIKLHKTVAELRTYIEAAPQGVLVIDDNCQIVLANQEAARIFDYTHDELVKQMFKELVPKMTCEYDKRTVINKDVISGRAVEMEGYKKDGSGFPLELNLSIIKTDTHSEAVIIFSDITLRKYLEAEALEARRIQAELKKERDLRQYKERFLSMFSHEFRNPLAVIETSTYLLKHYVEEMNTEKQIEHITHISNQAKHLDEMVKDILLLGQQEQQGIAVNPQSMSLHEFCSQVLDVVTKSMNSHEIIFHIDSTYDSIYLDARLMKHVLINILNNAIKYSPDAEEVHFRASAHTDTVVFEVQDFGIGIPENEQSVIFDLFQRATNVGNIQGTGLGLALVYEFIEMHDGTISFESEFGTGTTFKIELPNQEQDVVN